MLKEVYVVYRAGRFSRIVLGIFPTPVMAHESARLAKANDVDDYHKYQVVPYEMGKLLPFHNDSGLVDESLLVEIKPYSDTRYIDTWYN